ncbi:hypothetical protein BDU57DRAFT_510247 [Ampelomyces quisqualis]|uniref:Uncharacterized protein n=1 Tax=Ampelomyces quisqualis TaxID=50730 RepID=A0A6A5R691_AMPQU|nr:hypothetical protein BDU57DRAFT_510247 [Ampelomyces quisqualis]
MECTRSVVCQKCQKIGRVAQHSNKRTALMYKGIMFLSFSLFHSVILTYINDSPVQTSLLK